MLDASAMLPQAPTEHPPIILIHGAANSALVWTYWQRELATRGWPSYALNLRGHGRNRIDLSRTTMHDYADDVRTLVTQLARPPVIIGWSMGGLIAMMVAARGAAAACVGLAPSTPARQIDPSVTQRTGEFGAEEYGITSLDPEDQPAMPDLDQEERAIALASLSQESRLARDERKAGVVIESLPCPLYIITGTAYGQWPRERYDNLWLEASYLSIKDASHWGLVLSRRALATTVPRVIDWLGAVGVGG